MYKFLKKLSIISVGLILLGTIAFAEDTRILKFGDNLEFGSVKVGESVSRDLILYNEGNATLNISKLRFHQRIKAVYAGDWSGAIEPGESQHISITFTPNEVKIYNGLVYVKSDRTNSGDYSRLLKGEGTPVDDTNCTKILKFGSHLKFGQVKVGENTTKEITLYNKGTCPLTIEKFRFHDRIKDVFNGDFSGIIEAGGSKTATITFTPTENKRYSGLVYVQSDRTNTEEYSRALIGEGISDEEIDDENKTKVVIGVDESNITKTICSVIPDIDSEVFKKVDIMFLVDVSGSYGDDLATFRTQSSEIINSFALAGIDVKIGVSSFSDFPISPYGGGSDYAFRLDQPLTSDYPLVTTAINNLGLLWGSDEPESQLEGLFQTGESATGWREGALPIIFLATDASFHNSDDEVAYPGHGLTETVAKLNALGIKVFGLQSGGSIDDVIEIANLTDGSTFNLSGDSDEVVTAINNAIVGVSTDFTVSLVPSSDTAGVVQSITPDILGAHAGDSFTNVNSSDTVCFNVVFGRGIYKDEAISRNIYFSLKVLAEEVALIEEIPLKVTLERI